MATHKCKDCRFFRQVVSAIWCSQAKRESIIPNDSYECFTEKQKDGYENYQAQNNQQ